jgi:hypothetical protein
MLAVFSKPTTKATRELLCYLLAAGALAVYIQVFSHDYVNFDDGSYVFANPHVSKGLSAKSALWAFTSLNGDTSYWHPLTWLSHMLECQLFGLDPGRQHLTNVFLHIGNTLLLFLLLDQVTGYLWRSFCVAGLFAWHPLHVESVAWISERKDVLCTFFVLLTFHAYVAFVRHRSRRVYLLMITLFGFALMSKPMAVTVPVLLLLFDFWPLQRFKRGCFPAMSKECFCASDLRWILIEKVPFFVLSGIICILTVLAQKDVGAISSISTLPVTARVDNALVSYCLYLLKMFWPTRLAIFYPHPGHWPHWLVAVAFVSIASLTFFAVKSVDSAPYLAFGWGWYLVTLLPVIGLIQVGMQAMADRYTYLSLVGVFVAICWWLSDRLPKRPYFKVFGACSGVAVSCILLVLTNAQLKVWQSSLTLFTHAARVTDKNALASAQIGAELIRIGNTQEAYRIVSNALKDFPDDPDLLTQAGYALKEYEDPTDALNSFYRAIRSNPAASSAYLGLAELLSTHVNACYRNPKEAVRLAEEACLLVRTPGKAELKVLGEAYAEAGRFKEALEAARKAFEIAMSFGDFKLALMIREQEKLYEECKPYRVRTVTGMKSVNECISNGLSKTGQETKNTD